MFDASACRASCAVKEDFSGVFPKNRFVQGGRAGGRAAPRPSAWLLRQEKRYYIELPEYSTRQHRHRQGLLCRKDPKKTIPETPAVHFSNQGDPLHLKISCRPPRCCVQCGRRADRRRPFQAAAHPCVAGWDSYGCAQTGTGKPAAFGLPMLDALAAAKPKSPVRSGRSNPDPDPERATIRPRALPPTASICPCAAPSFSGGVGQVPQVQALRSGLEILAACPGRLKDP